MTLFLRKSCNFCQSRNDRGRVHSERFEGCNGHGSHNSYLRGLYPAREAKALCMKELLTWLKERQLDTCIIKTDSM